MGVNICFNILTLDSQVLLAGDLRLIEVKETVPVDFSECWMSSYHAIICKCT